MTRPGRASLLAPLTIAIALGPLLLGARGAGAQAPAAMNAADIDRLVGELSNWGRWGESDQLGTLNLITPATRQAAARLVRTGRSVSLSRALASPPGGGGARAPFTLQMLSQGRGATGVFATDRFSVAHHGTEVTHLDALSHVFHNGRMYNGFSRDEVSATGAEKLSIANARQGVVTRGLLIDVPRLRGVRFLEPGDAVLPGDFDAWERETGLRIGPGDAVLVRTGRWLRLGLLGEWDTSAEGMAGMHASCAAWLKRRDVAVVGSDGSGDVTPSGVDGIGYPMHVLLLHAMGTPMLDNCDLEGVAERAAELGAWEFLLTVAPLAAERGTGSAVNPIATF